MKNQCSAHLYFQAAERANPLFFSTGGFMTLYRSARKRANRHKVFYLSSIMACVNPAMPFLEWIDTRSYLMLKLINKWRYTLLTFKNVMPRLIILFALWNSSCCQANGDVITILRCKRFSIWLTAFKGNTTNIVAWCSGIDENRPRFEKVVYSSCNNKQFFIQHAPNYRAQKSEELSPVHFHLPSVLYNLVHLQ